MLVTEDRRIVLANRLIAATAGMPANADAVELRVLLEPPTMTEILTRVPGKTIRAKCKLLGVSPQTFQLWRNGDTRPAGGNVKRLAQLTGVPEEVIRGR